jgi:hypothetical protein
MTNFLDELARSLAKPMPRRRALRLVGGAVVAVALPGIRTTKARAASRFHDCVPKGGLLCECNCGGPNGDVCQRICCTPKDEYECNCGTVAEGASCKCRRKCGSACCKSTQYCGSAKHALCCNVGLGFGKEEACVGKNLAQCCKPGFKCCGEACCHSLTQKCTEDGTCECKRGNTKSCGGDCCNPKTQKCCPGSISEKHCAPKDSVCCGPKWCSKNQRCCKGPLGGGVQGTICVPKTQECCGAIGYNEATHKCCGRSHTCPKATTCCDNDCCDPGEECTPEGCKAPSHARAYRRAALVGRG